MDQRQQEGLTRATQLIRYGQYGEAATILEAILADDPTLTAAMKQLAIIRIAQRAYPQAAAMLDRVLTSTPDDGDARQMFGSVLLELRRREEGLDHLRAVAKDVDASPDVLARAGGALLDEQDIEPAILALQRAHEQRPDQTRIIQRLAEALRQANRTEDALELLLRAVENQPEDQQLRAYASQMLERANRVTDAARILKEGPGDADSPGLLVVRGSLAVRQGDWNAARDMLERAMAAGEGQPLYLHPLSARERLTAGQMLAEVCEQAGEYDESLRWIRATKPSPADLSESDRRAIAQYDQFMAIEQELITESLVRSWPDPPTGDRPSPIFMIGFPRSGTTLLEQILGSHPKIRTTDEAPALHAAVKHLGRRCRGLTAVPAALEGLSSAEILELRSIYWDVIDRRCRDLDVKAHLVVDKHPMNAPNLIVARRLFPDARVIFSLRDPRDVCLSCFAKLSTTTISTAKFHSLAAAADFYKQLMDVAVHMKQTLGMPWLEVKYEDVISRTEDVARQVIDFTGLDWDEQVMRFTERASERYIRTPSYRAVAEGVHDRARGKWRHYASHFEDINDVLEPYVQRFGY